MSLIVFQRSLYLKLKCFANFFQGTPIHKGQFLAQQGTPAHDAEHNKYNNK